MTPDSSAWAKGRARRPSSTEPPSPLSPLSSPCLPSRPRNQPSQLHLGSPQQVKCCTSVPRCGRVKRESAEGRKRKVGHWLCPFLPERVTNQQGRGIAASRSFQGPGRPQYLRAPLSEYNGTEAIRLHSPLFSSGHSQGGLGEQAFIGPGVWLCFPALSYSSWED